MNKRIFFIMTIIFIVFAFALMWHDIADMPRMTQTICDGQLGRCLS